uniref:Gustatory receptor n=1 Tax=Tetranychus urticae TaxID=32264 RepID=T1K0I5_TETUR
MVEGITIEIQKILNLLAIYPYVDEFSEYKSYPKWLIIITLGVLSFLHGLHSCYWSFIYLCHFESTFTSITKCLYDIHYDLISIIRGLVVLFMFDWAALDNHVSITQKVWLKMDQKSHEFIIKSRRFKLIVMTFSSLNDLIWTLVGAYLFPTDSEDFKDRPSIYKYVIAVCEFVTVMGWLFMLNMISEICINLQAMFAMINQKLTDHPFNIDHLTDQIKIYRSYYSLTIRATQSAETFLCYYLTIVYIEFIYSNLVNNIFNLASPTNSLADSLQILCYNLSTTTYLFYLTYNLIKVNYFSHKGSEDLYELSLLTDDNQCKQEIELFLYRMSKKDVGFTFSKLFVITPNFITSLFTLALTLILASPSFKLNPD